MALKHLQGMTGFRLVWAGQIASVLASSMTQFALTIWAYERTGSATTLGLIQTAFIVPFLLLSPLAGVWVDRYNRKLMMMVSDLAAVLATIGILFLDWGGQLQIWHLYVAAVVNGLGNTFQWPAYSAAISTMVSKEDYSRANGMMSLIESVPAVFSPILAGLLLPLIHLRGILTLDVLTFGLAIGALLIVYVPQPRRTVEGQGGAGSVWSEALYGFRYIFDRPGLKGLLLFFLALNFVIGLSVSLTSPFILERTANDSAALGVVQSGAAIGAVVGGIFVGLWGGFKRRTKSIFWGEALTGLFVLTLFGMARSLPVWVLVSVIGGIFPVFTNGASQAIWQAKVAPDVQGRVFAARRMIAWSVGPITPVLAGLLADRVTEPAMQNSESVLSALFGWLLGNQPGAGMGLQFVLTGVVYMAIVLIVVLFFPVVRNLEDTLSDHDLLPPAHQDPLA